MDESEVPSISAAELSDLLTAGVALLDVREPDEYEAGHVSSAVLIPLGELPDRTAEIPAGRPLYVICHSGRRSGLAVRALREAGVDAWNVGCGTGGWVDQGYPVVMGSSPT
jgi:rhodanese-related sulfurtransferase